ncbi:type III-B CRISPR module RAMP protein Cmr4 [Salinibacter sp.]|uniref:type III-B CRISPR module RAMP protein Cmr4 n=1 Tax=Salinibacter sp. TaxID=2065818 RepID=UPI0021E88853|nr:type III-B CRISPR module RAMP protein Cmr4 [Salinibacter sp.]
MYTHSHPFYLHARTPLHAGSGSDLGVVDLPIQRERHTGHPKIEGSSLKGAIREAFRHLDRDALGQPQRNALFGPDPDRDEGVEDLFAGALGFTDARLLLFPVKSLKGVFAWVTCPSVLRRWREELSHAGEETGWDVPSPRTAPEGSDLVVTVEHGTARVVLEEYTFEVSSSEKTQAVANEIERAVGIDSVADRLLVLTDDAYQDLVEMATEVITRTKINPDTGTVQDGQLFTEEYLPPESVLYFLGLASSLKNGREGVFGFEDSDEHAAEVLSTFRDHVPEALQIGANATTGKGLVSVTA